jgi:hypothetical protein
VLIGADRDPVEALDPSLAAGWRSLRGGSLNFGTAGWTDVDGKYGQWFDARDARVMLVRPDFHIFGTSTGDTESTNLLVADLLCRVTQPTERPCLKTR